VYQKFNVVEIANLKNAEAKLGGEGHVGGIGIGLGVTWPNAIGSQGEMREQKKWVADAPSWKMVKSSVSGSSGRLCKSRKLRLRNLKLN
jgi:hypothetical protein